MTLVVVVPTASTRRRRRHWQMIFCLQLQQKLVLLLLLLMFQIILQVPSSFVMAQEEDMMSFTSQHEEYLNMTLPPSSTEITFFQHTLTAPNTINFGLLLFKTSDSSNTTENTVHSFIDIVEFIAPEECQSPLGCGDVWSQLGVGAVWDRPTTTTTNTADSNTTETIVQWCCTPEAVQAGVCEESKLGRLILDDDKVDSGVDGIFHRIIIVPSHGGLQTRLKFAHLENRTAGPQVALMANCNDHGRNIDVVGPLHWEGSFEDGTSTIGAPPHSGGSTGGTGSDSAGPVPSPTVAPQQLSSPPSSSSLVPPTQPPTQLPLTQPPTQPPLLSSEEENGDNLEPSSSSKGGSWWPILAVLLILALAFLFVRERIKNKITQRELVEVVEQQRNINLQHSPMMSSMSSIDIDLLPAGDGVFNPKSPVAQAQEKPSMGKTLLRYIAFIPRHGRKRPSLDRANENLSPWSEEEDEGGSGDLKPEVPDEVQIHFEQDDDDRIHVPPMRAFSDKQYHDSPPPPPLFKETVGSDKLHDSFSSPPPATTHENDEDLEFDPADLILCDTDLPINNDALAVATNEMDVDKIGDRADAKLQDNSHLEGEELKEAESGENDDKIRAQVQTLVRHYEEFTDVDLPGIT